MTDMVAFISYARHDDTHSHGEITKFHRRLLADTRLQFGREVQIFFDQGIEWGEQWNEAINGTLGKAAVLIPMLSPAFFASVHCRKETQLFIEYEARIGAKDLIRPIYFIGCPEIDTPDAFPEDKLLKTLIGRQHSDWRHWRFVDSNSLELKHAYAKLSERIAKIARERKGWSDQGKVGPRAGAQRTVQAVVEILDRDVSFESLVAYTILKFPNKPVSVHWTNRLLSDIDPVRYKKIADIEEVVQVAYDSVESFANSAPELFQYSTDHITKSLIFVDANFRSVHGVASKTRMEAERANITKYR